MADTTHLDNDPFCTCGRLAAKIHCPVCGSADVRAKGQKHWERHTREINGVLTHVTVPVYSCRRCASLFNDEQWRLRCQAPPVSLTRRKLTPGDSDYKRPEDVLTPEQLAKAQTGDITDLFGPEAQKVLEKYLK